MCCVNKLVELRNQKLELITTPQLIFNSALHVVSNLFVYQALDKRWDFANYRSVFRVLMGYGDPFFNVMEIYIQWGHCPQYVFYRNSPPPPFLGFFFRFSVRLSFRVCSGGHRF
eukprot:TRINITY_DN95808_c0_g1_i1.p4 TRINITY_DN95808_c0_g1~~TRINITY_DN95808_c0_g1_i1.p4  ORF type:complete len:114 (+),score=2.25 TRINITY_DN95808_c0_g1_i1:102-443(+)